MNALAGDVNQQEDEQDDDTICCTLISLTAHAFIQHVCVAQHSENIPGRNTYIVQ
jgi:hypothetical protein